MNTKKISRDIGLVAICLVIAGATYVTVFGFPQLPGRSETLPPQQNYTNNFPINTSIPNLGDTAGHPILSLLSALIPNPIIIYHSSSSTYQIGVGHQYVANLQSDTSIFSIPIGDCAHFTINNGANSFSIHATVYNGTGIYDCMTR